MFLGVKLYSSAPTFTLVFYRSVVQALLSGVLLLRERKNPLGGTAGDVGVLLALRAASGSLAVAALFYAVQHLPLPDAVTLQFTTPVFAAAAAVPLLGEPWRRSDAYGAALCLSGVLMIARPSWLFGAGGGAAAATAAAAASGGNAVATAVGLAGAALAALAYVLVRRIGSRADANTMVFYYAVFSALTAPLGSRLLGGNGGGGGTWDVMGTPTASELLVFAGLGVFGFLGQLFTNMGLTACDSAATATLVSNTQIVFAFLFEITILHESLSPWSIAGSALIVGYLAYAGMKVIAKEKKAAALTKSNE
jgi:drug/metabolite transporter (DMT)-like permease